MSKRKIQHSPELIQWIESIMQEIPANRRPMFGCPAYFIDRQLSVCIYENVVGLKLPEHRVKILREHHDIKPFRPYQKSAMREWLAIEPKNLKGIDPKSLILEAVAYAKRGIR